jgi:hypothetical protein
MGVRSTILPLLGCVFVAFEQIRSAQLMSAVFQSESFQQEQTLLASFVTPKKRALWRDKDDGDKDDADLEDSIIVSEEVLAPPPSKKQDSLVIDIVSVGSNSRLDYLATQRETFGRHHAVRNYIGLTEDASSEPNCDATVSPDAAKAIQNYCRLDVSLTFPDNAPGTLLNRMRQIYAGWDDFLATKKNPGGWLCAQRRASDGLYRLLQLYKTQPIPDYVILMDDDTFVDLSAVSDYLTAVYDSNDATVMVGCLIRFVLTLTNFAIPWGGWGTILSRGAIQNLLRPINCNYIQDDFEQNACDRLDQNLFDEQRYWQTDMTVMDLINAYVMTNRYSDYQKWSESKGSFCVHSDWVWGYFFNYYNIGNHTGHTAHTETDRMTTYRISYTYAVYPPRKEATDGQCRMEGVNCTVDSDICHYVSSDLMRNLTAIHEADRPDDYGEELRVSKEWNALWTKPVQSPVMAKPVEAKTDIHSTPIPVFVYPFKESSLTDELKHFAWDGVQRSERLQMTLDAAEAPIWIVDTRAARLDLPKQCHDFLDVIKRARRKKDAAGELPEWKVGFLYWEDSSENEFFDCFRTIRLISSTQIYRFKRSVVEGRQWRVSKYFIEPGRVLQYGNWRDHAAAPVRHINYGVRTDMVEGLQQLSVERTSHLKIKQAPTAERLALYQTRSTDVAHFWPLKRKETRKVVHGKGSRLRDAVSETLYTSFVQNDRSSASPLRVFLDLAGQAQQYGRNHAQAEYLSQLLDSKIVVVSQRDGWEDHYRLMEALASGALVMTDPMLAMPAGLKDGESVVVYTSLEDLVAKVRYYLEAVEERQRIALEGLKVSMTHRSWNMMESIVFDNMLVRQ